jgi:simple sugar transport system permease protein
MKIRFSVNEVISTLMLNYVALNVLMYLIRGPMRDQTSASFAGMVFPQSALIPEALFLPLLLERTRLHLGLFLALVVLLAAWLFCRSSSASTAAMSSSSDGWSLFTQTWSFRCRQ